MGIEYDNMAKIKASIEEEIRQNLFKKDLHLEHVKHINREVRTLRGKISKVGKDSNDERKAPRRKILHDVIVQLLLHNPDGLSPMMMYEALPRMTEEKFERCDVYNEIKIMKDRYMVDVRREQNKRLWTLCDKGEV